MQWLTVGDDVWLWLKVVGRGLSCWLAMVGCGWSWLTVGDDVWLWWLAGSGPGLLFRLTLAIDHW